HELPWRAVSLFSGNNLTFTDDMAQRTLVSRIESAREEPRKRPLSTFRHPDLLRALRPMRGRLVWCALVVLRAFAAAREAGEDVPAPTPWGTFGAWAALVPPAIVWAGGPDVCDARPEGGSGGSEEGEAHLQLVNAWRDDWNGLTAKRILDAI